MALSICLLARNSEANMERVLRSTAGLAAEVIVGDTGSTDGTVARAQALGAQTLAIPWDDDFAAAQNQILDRAAGEWILWLNPDEELMPSAAEKLSPLLARPEALAYLVPVQELKHPDQQNPIEMLLPRLYRRRPELRYIGRLHPHFITPLEELARRENLHVHRADFLIRRHGYLSALTPDKLRWATHLLELELKDRPGQLHYLIQYGRNLLLQNDPRGHEVMAEASEQVLAAKSAAVPPLATVAELLEYLLTVAPEQSKSRISRTQARQLALHWFPNSPPLFWALAQQSFQGGDFRDAAGHLERLLHLGRTGTYDRSAAFDPSIMAEPALVNLGQCYLASRDLDRAEQCFCQAFTSPTHGAQARKGFEMVQQLRQSP